MLVWISSGNFAAIEPPEEFMEDHATEIVRTTVVCTKCEIPFLVEGQKGKGIEILLKVRCPYPECQNINDVLWFSENSHKVVPIYNKR